MKVEIQTTADGSPTLYRSDIDEHYHSVKGAVVESRHVYIESGWRKAAESFDPVVVFEVGFGTGLNAALTAQTALSAGKKTIYFSVELNPLPKATTDALLPYQGEDYRREFVAVNEAGWDKPTEINPCFTLIKMRADLLEMEFPQNINVVYFDAFAPEKQSEMWGEEIFRKLYDAMTPGGIFTTYCAKGVIRRRLQSVGFITERLPGPPAGKREILRSYKDAGIDQTRSNATD
ncbi:MAG: tRNA (5-methylaminomethyl-2-thiouridine)(34)-methyltransferase MnmD [Bacteroidales bacterium]|nr:tRNA (5-methylaminomethyl-2-thiouridine)(34)-methyltransferase MnmD [Bacteroidales bacterium]